MSNNNSEHSLLVSRVVAVIVFSLLVSSCASPKITMAPGAQPVFKLSGRNSVMFFQVAGNDSPGWRIVPNDNNTNLNNLGEIKYGEVPPNCHQFEPKVGPAPTLAEGHTYTALAMIFDDPAVSISFVVKDGKAVPIPDQQPK